MCSRMRFVFDSGTKTSLRLKSGNRMKLFAKAYLSAVLVLFPGLWAVGQSYPQPGAPLWTNRYNGGGPTYANPKATATDKSGNVFVTGYVGNNPYHFATVAYSPTGTPAWTNSWSSQ